MEPTLFSDKVNLELNALENKIYQKHWSDYSRASFIYNLGQTIESLEKVKSVLLERKKTVQKEGRGTEQVDEHIKELSVIIDVLERNHKMEHSRVQKAKEKGIEILADDIVNSDLYSSLEQKVLGFVLKTRFFTERLSIAERKESTGAPLGKSTSRVFELLEEKENEIQSLKKKYEETRHNSFLARIEEHTSHDIEKEINEVSRKIEGEHRVMEIGLDSLRKQAEQLHQNYALLKQKFSAADEMNLTLVAKTSELATTLKKERDYAKRIVLDIENETLKLRNSYSRQLLSLEEEKAAAKAEARLEHVKKIETLERALSEKNESLSHMRELLAQKEKQIQGLAKKAAKNSKQ